jgi:hypothetical protein
VWSTKGYLGRDEDVYSSTRQRNAIGHKWAVLNSLGLRAVADSRNALVKVAFRMSRKTRTKAYSTNILDYHSNLSMYEKDSLASEAKLKAEREKKKPSKSPKRSGLPI